MNEWISIYHFICSLSVVDITGSGHLCADNVEYIGPIRSTIRCGTKDLTCACLCKNDSQVLNNG